MEYTDCESEISDRAIMWLGIVYTAGTVALVYIMFLATEAPFVYRQFAVIGALVAMVAAYVLALKTVKPAREVKQERVICKSDR